MGILIKQFGGIDQKSNHLTRKPEDLRDARNIAFDTSGYIVKRPGTEAGFASPSGTIDSYYFKSADEMFFVVNESNKIEFYKQDSAGTNTKLTRFTPDITTTSYANAQAIVGSLSCAEYLGCLEFTFTTGTYDVMKYDTDTVYFAGIPATIAVESGGTAGPLFFRTFYEYTDYKGNIFYGPYTQTSGYADSTITVNTFYGDITNPNNGFFRKRISLSLAAAATVSLNSGSRSFTSTAVSGFVAGEKVLIQTFSVSMTARAPGTTITKTNNNSTLVYMDSCELTIESVVGLVVTFTAASFTDSLSIVINNPFPVTTTFYVGSRTRIICSTSFSANLDYDRQFAFPIGASSLTFAIVPDYIINRVETLDLLSYYDITTSKLRPPRCKYIATYGGQLVVGAATGIYDFNNNFNVFKNDDLVFYSDISEGDLGENFTATNFEVIGNTFDGSITGMARVRDSLAIFKTRNVFAMDGVLAQGEYSLRRVETNGAGCLSHKSILANQDFLFFQGQDGLYTFTGFKVDKVTTKLDPFFAAISSTDLQKTRSCLDLANDRWLFYVNSGSSHYIVAFDFNYKQWLIWDGLDCSLGLSCTNDYVVRLLSSSSKKMNSSLFQDSSVAFEAYIKTGWMDLQKPSLQKKANQLRMFSFNPTTAIYSISHYIDWNESKVKTSTVTIPSGFNTELQKLDIRTCQSWSVKISNSENKNICISGIDFGLEPWQVVDKNA